MGILRITVDNPVRVEASTARVHVTFRGSATLTTGLAGRKAAVVRELVAELAAHDVPEEAVEVTSVHIATTDGRLVRSQTAEIALTVSATPDQLPEVLGALADRPGVSVDQLEWSYDEFEASIPATAAAMVMARRKADAVATAAGLRVVGVAEASDSWSRPAPRPAPMLAMASRSASAPVDLGLEFSATTVLSVHLSVDFELSSPVAGT
jgi:uncharacterized protein YggE